MKKITALIVLLLTLLLALTACDRFAVAGAAAQATATPQFPDVETFFGGVIAEGSVVPQDSLRVYTRSGGDVAEVLVKEGDVVEKDAVLLRFGNREANQAALTAAQLEQTSAQQALDDLEEKAALSGSAAQIAVTQAEKALVAAQQALDDFNNTDQNVTDLDNARKDVTTAKDDLKDAQDEADKYKDMDPDNADRKRTEDLLDDAQKKYNDMLRKVDLLVTAKQELEANVADAQAKRDQAQRDYDTRKDAPDPKQLALAEARLANAQAQVAAAQKALDNLEIRAPFAGTITDLELSAGETVLPNQPVLQMADFSAWYVETTDLDELEVVRIQEGQAATVLPDALKASNLSDGSSDITLPATVESIERFSGKKGGDVTYTVRLKLNETDPRLRWGMTVEVRFEQP